MFCKGHHEAETRPCGECSELLAYALERLDRCPFQEKKPTCADCTIHCYRQEQKKRTIQVMRYAGPRMLRRHPYLAVRHLLDGFLKRGDGPRQSRR